MRSFVKSDLSKYFVKWVWETDPGKVDGGESGESLPVKFVFEVFNRECIIEICDCFAGSKETLSQME